MGNQYLTTPFEMGKMKERGAEKLLSSCVPTENFFNPIVADLEKMSKFLEDCSSIADIGSGYGLLISKLAKMNPSKKFLGIDTVYWSGHEFPIPKELPNLKFEFNGIEAMCNPRRFGAKSRRFDCVICSWMPHGSEWREYLAKLSTKKIILVLSKDFNTGTELTYTGMGKFGFDIIGKAWTSSDSLIQLWYRKTSKGEQDG